MKQTSFVIMGCILVCLLAGCATSYHAKGSLGGYSDSQLGQDEYIVYFSGNGFTATERSRDFCLLRAAELTLQKGYTHFVVMGDIARDAISGGGGNVYTFPNNELKIKCFKSKPDGVNSYDATFLQQSLRQKYNITS